MVTTALNTAIPNVTLVAVATTHTTHNLLHHHLLLRNPDPPGLTVRSASLVPRARMDQREYQDLLDRRVRQDFLDLLVA